MRITAKDFDMNGTFDPVCSYYVQGKCYPLYQRNLLLSQIPSLKNKFKTYEEYARATMADIFPENSLRDAYVKDSRFFETTYIENLGNGSFKLHPLPVEAQTSPVFGILPGDFNSDGNFDLLLVGNSYSSNIYTGQYDSFIGLFLEGNGKGEFSPVPGKESGFYVPGDAKAIAGLTMKDGSSLILISQNSDSTMAFKVMKSQSKIIKVKNDDVSAELKYKTGETEYYEFFYGSGYLSQSSRVLRVAQGVMSVNVTNYKGETRRISIDKNE
jgi:enediyne biosynthesis protein E4